MGKLVLKFLCVFLLCLGIPMNVMGSEPFFKYKGVINKKGTLNVLIIGKDKADPVKISRLLGENTKDITLEQIGDKDYQEGKVYYPENNKNIRFTYFTIDKFLSPDFEKEYDGEFIAQNMNVCLYMCSEYPKVFDELKSFYHKFNKFWCGKDLDYEVAPGKMHYEACGDYRDNWFKIVLNARNIITKHRMIYFLFNGNAEITTNKFRVCRCHWIKDKKLPHEKPCMLDMHWYIAAMPDGRDIYPCELNDKSDIRVLNEYLKQTHESFQPTTLYDNDNILKNKKVNEDQPESQNAFMKFVKSKYFPFVAGGAGLVVIGSLGYLGYRIYQNKSKNSKNLSRSLTNVNVQKK